VSGDLADGKNNNWPIDSSPRAPIGDQQIDGGMAPSYARTHTPSVILASSIMQSQHGPTQHLKSNQATEKSEDPSDRRNGRMLRKGGGSSDLPTGRRAGRPPEGSLRT